MSKNAVCPFHPNSIVHEATYPEYGSHYCAPRGQYADHWFTPGEPEAAKDAPAEQLDGNRFAGRFSELELNQLEVLLSQEYGCSLTDRAAYVVTKLLEEVRNA